MRRGSWRPCRTRVDDFAPCLFAPLPACVRPRAELEQSDGRAAARQAWRERAQGRAHPHRRGALLRRHRRCAPGRRHEGAAGSGRRGRPHQRAGLAGNSDRHRHRARCRARRAPPLRWRRRARLRHPRRHHSFRDRVASIGARLDGAFGRAQACPSATASSPSTPRRRPGRAPAWKSRTKAATPRAPRWRWSGSSGGSGSDEMDSRRSQGGAQGQQARRGAARRRAGALSDGPCRHRA